MRKEDSDKTRLCVQYDDHSRLMCTVLCSLMEHQSLVDLAIRCGNNTMHAHKCILAASSPYFREQLEKNPGTEQVIINGLDFATMKSVIEFIYCGETNILEENLKHVVAAAKLFQIRGLQALASETHFEADESIYIPPPIFINKKPKYSSAYVPYAQNPPQKLASGNKMNLDPNYRALKHDEAFINHIEGMPLQVVDYSELSAPIISAPMMQLNGKTLGSGIIPFDLSCTGAEKTVDKIKDVFSQEMQTNVEIMYKTPEGEYVKVTDEVLRNITGDTLQFQVIDEHGREGELQLLDDKIKIKPGEDKNRRKFADSFNQFINTPYAGDGNNPENVDLDSILMNFPDQNGKELEEVGQDGNMPLMTDLTVDESGEMGGGLIDGGDKAIDMRPDNDDNTDILKEINSMQFCDNSVYEDVAEKIESAFKSGYAQKDMHVIDVDQPISLKKIKIGNDHRNENPGCSIVKNRNEEGHFY